MDEYVVSMLIFASVQLFSRAVIGEYLGQGYVETEQRPLFIIREIVSGLSANEQHPVTVGELIDEARTSSAIVKTGIFY